MEELLGLSVIIAPLVALLNIASIIFSILFMHYSAKHRNQPLTTSWYVCGVLFGFITLLVFLVKRSKFPGPDTRVCPQCGEKYIDESQFCVKCSAPLPVLDKEQKAKEHKYAKGFAIAVVVTYVLACILGAFVGAMTSKAIIEELNAEGVLSGESSFMSDLADLLATDGDADEGTYSLSTYKIAVDGLYYDKNGNSYGQEGAVPMYTQDGRVFTLSLEEVLDEEDQSYYYANMYVCEDGSMYHELDCYVDEDGWFRYDVKDSLYYGEITDDEVSDTPVEYAYYAFPYTDDEGKRYYSAYEASWNSEGKLIVSAEDIK